MMSYCVEDPSPKFNRFRVLDANGKPARAWLTVLLDDYSRAVPGYMVFRGAPLGAELVLPRRNTGRQEVPAP